MILLVDDDIVVVTIMKTILENLGMPHASVSSLDDAKEYLLIHSATTSMVISDLNLHDTSGLDLMMYIKTTWPEMPFVLMSAETNSQRAKLYPISPDAFLAKPFTVDTISELMSSLGIQSNQ